MPDMSERILELSRQGLKPHAIARELMGAVPINVIYEIVEKVKLEDLRSPCWRTAEVSLRALGRDLTADDYVEALRKVTGREMRRLSVLQQLSRRARQGIVKRVGKGTYRLLEDKAER